MTVMGIFRWVTLCGIVVAVCSCAHSDRCSQDRTLFQTSTITALLEGGYDGVVSCGELRRRGDLGIGTFDRLDGELILLDGEIFQARANDTVAHAPDSLKVPFAVVTRFVPGVSLTNGPVSDYVSLKKQMDAVRRSENLFYAVRVEGVFGYVKYRSVPPQDKPYPKLTEVASRQPVFERRAIRGTLVGFWCPEYAKTLNVPGWHLHFISEDRKSGGHLLECAWEGGVIQSETLLEIQLSLPEGAAFQRLSLGGDSTGAIKAVESGK